MEAYKIISEEVKECPFCNGADIRYSVSKANDFALYHSQCYCNTCKCYGPRVTWQQDSKYLYPNRADAERNKEAKTAAINLWNKREG